ncbi:hypothetical protein PAP_08655 [Palaeococcus pacificus DY20341]|uniref:Iron ABC transporter permease n=1 Tax=Palaeococcus pacificus DY20341 TaxID=1343739 RepID=A0A075LVU7_9EURY|nr:iron ABC transporter permease [Palaeococcus pacificus]AIF70112.1 hypothetical protein PAP_08655 [Palaeococcus pacificus DY20341]
MNITHSYSSYVKRKAVFGTILLFLLFLSFVFSLSVGSYKIPFGSVVRAMLGMDSSKASVVVWNVRLPRAIAALLVGAGLAISGAVMQVLLRNPLASPFTMGISHGAMFGASLAILLGAGSAESSGRIVIVDPNVVVVFAFLGSLLAVAVVLTLAKLKGLSPEAMILAGVAMSSLFIASTTLVQYFADELQLAAMVYWSFGDLGRAVWEELLLIALTLVPSLLYFFFKGWDYNALEAGDEVAKSLGVSVERVRLFGTLLASLITAVSVAFVGIIGFVGLICPHLVRLIIGSDYRFLLPSSALLGALLLLLSDTLARTIIAPMILPVGVITSFLGAPLFVYLLVKMEGRA